MQKPTKRSRPSTQPDLRSAGFPNHFCDHGWSAFGGPTMAGSPSECLALGYYDQSHHISSRPGSGIPSCFGGVLEDAWVERSIPSGSLSSQTDLGTRYPAALNGYPADVRMIWLVAKRDRPHQRRPAVHLRVADGPPRRIRDKGQQHLPGTRLGLLVNTGCREKRNVISLTCWRRLTCAP